MGKPSRRSIPHSYVVCLLAKSLGDERARAVWADALRQTSTAAADAYTADETRTLLDTIAQFAGGAGVGARAALVWLGEGDAALGMRATRAPEKVFPEDDPDRSLAGSGDGTDVYLCLLDLFTPAFGREKAREALSFHAGHIGLEARALTDDEGRRLLDALGNVPGLLGVVANFAKVKFLMRYPG